jgi:hypothetical protein
MKTLLALGVLSLQAQGYLTSIDEKVNLVFDFKTASNRANKDA